MTIQPSLIATKNLNIRICIETIIRKGHQSTGLKVYALNDAEKQERKY
jgi:hypothetical protein